MKVLSVALLLSLVALSQALTSWKKPDFCGKSECPPFDLEEDRETYEIRTYDKSEWVHYNVTGSRFEVAYTKGTAALMKYFNGDNKDKEKFDLTTPTLCAMKLSKDAQKSERDYVFSMWLDPESFKDKAPKPKNKDMWIDKYPETTVFVRSFGGFATESTIMQETNALHEELLDDNEEFDDKWVFTAVYDPAVKLLNRHNEVHVMEKGQEPSFIPTIVVA